MKTAALLWVAGLALCQPAWADWSPVARSSRGQYYLDESSIRDTDKGRMAFYLLDLKAPDIDGKRSYRFLYEFDCARGRQRFIRREEFDDQMGQGASSVDNDASRFFSTPKPGTVDARIVKTVCAAALK